MGTRVSYTQEVKMKAIKMYLGGIPFKQVLIELNIRQKTQEEHGRVCIKTEKYSD